MAGVLLSGPAGSGKSQRAQQVLSEAVEPAVIIDFQSLLAALLGLERQPDGRYPPRVASQAYALATAEYLRRAAITSARNSDLHAIVTNSDGNPVRRQDLLGFIGAGATEELVGAGLTRDEILDRLRDGDGVLDQQCIEAADRWFFEGVNVGNC